MTIKELKFAIKDLPDDAQVLIPAPDHSYECTTWNYTKVEQYRPREFYEYFDDASMCSGSVAINALVIS